jgi:predicted ATPase
MISETERTLIGKRYVLEDQLGAGGMGAVYKTTDRLRGSLVALKKVTTPTQQLLFNSRAESTDLYLALAQEFKTLATLRHPNVVSVLDYGFDESRQPYFTMELLDEAQTIVEAGQGQPLGAQIELILQLLQALAYLHRRGVLHRDLKPANVMVVDGQVKVLDFGLSVMAAGSVAQITQTTAGTFAYMAPEILQGERASKGADLYAVGMMAYEIIAGKYPFDTKALGILITSIMATPVDVGSIGVNTEVSDVLGRLLAKSREGRYGNANNVIEDLCAAIDCPVPPETIEIRESFLQAANFVGRDAEMNQLAEILDSAMAGQGAAWLVAGESGVGKSRLVDELRTLALVQGAVVLRGQAVSEGGTHYQVWRDPLRRMALISDLDDEQASPLKALVPDIGDLQGRQVPDSPAVDPLTAQIRLLRAVREMFQGQDQPVVVILEDMQWAGSNSIALFDRLTSIVGELPLLIVGNYRDDERPDLPELLPEAKSLKLERLTETGTADLIESMIGAIGREPKVVDLLQNETEGNPFFVVETVRALAEEAGQLDQISSTSLPDKIFAGGIQEIVRRRLNRIPSRAQALLRLAAVAGRELDLRVLNSLNTGISVDAWLNLSSDAAVVEIMAGNWRFTHDKLREGALEELSEDERPALHRQVAEAIELVYPNASEQAAGLAYHWSVAGDEEEELHYRSIAGQSAFENYANDEAVGHLLRALDLLKAKPETQERIVQEAELQIPLSVALMTLKGYAAPEVGQGFSRTRELCRQIGDAPQLAPALYGMAMYHLVRAEFQSCFELSESIRSTAGNADDPSLFLTTAYCLQGMVYLFQGEFKQCLESTERVFLHAKPEHSPIQILLFGLDLNLVAHLYHAFALQMLGYPDQARDELKQELIEAQESTHPYTWDFSMAHICFIYVSRRDAKMTRRIAEQKKRNSADHGIAYGMILSVINLGWVLTEEQQLDAGIGEMLQGVGLWQSVGAACIVPLYFSSLAEAYRRGGRYAEGLDVLEHALKHIEESGEHFYESDVQRVMGEILLRQGAGDKMAEEYFNKAIRVAQNQKGRTLELRATVSLCRLWQKQSKTVEAREKLEQINGWFTEGFDTRDLVEARELLEELGH